MKRDQSAGEQEDVADADGDMVVVLARHGYGKPILVGTTAPPSSPLLRNEASALRLAAIAKDTGKHCLVSVSERMSMLFESILKVCRIIMVHYLVHCLILIDT